MSEMIDRVAKAIEQVPVMEGTYAMSGDDARKLARAAIEAMREPTEEMSAAGHEKGRFRVTGGTIFSEYSEDPPELEDDAPEEIWTAMCDAALKG